MSQTYHLRRANTLLPPTKRQRERLQSFIEALPTLVPSLDGSLSIDSARLRWAPDGLAIEVLEQNEAPPIDLTHLIWHALDLGLGLSVGEPEDYDEWETDAIAMVFGFRPEQAANPGPTVEAEPIQRPTIKVIPLKPHPSLRLNMLGPNWEELFARGMALDACDGKISGPFTLWVVGIEALLITPDEFAPMIAEQYAFHLHEPIRLPPDARPILTRRLDGSFVRLWSEVPRGRKAVQTIKYEWGKWRWENRPYRLID